MTRFHLHLVSDSTGETLESVAKACLVQFESAEPVKHYWPMVRSQGGLERVITEIAARPGLVLFTLVNAPLRDHLASRCLGLGLPAVSILDPVLEALSQVLGQRARGLPGRQHALDAAYFRRIEAMQFTMAHDDGQLTEDLNEADIVVVGVSRTSKTPTSIYLANRGYKTANVPLMPEIALPEALLSATRPLIVGLTTSPDRLLTVRRTRLLTLQQDAESPYIDPDRISEELAFARRLYARYQWPVLDVTRRSIEESAAAIITLLSKRGENNS